MSAWARAAAGKERPPSPPRFNAAEPSKDPSPPPTPNNTGSAADARQRHNSLPTPGILAAANRMHPGGAARVGARPGTAELVEVMRGNIEGLLPQDTGPATGQREFGEFGEFGGGSSEDEDEGEGEGAMPVAQEFDMDLGPVFFRLQNNRHAYLNEVKRHRRFSSALNIEALAAEHPPLSTGAEHAAQAIYKAQAETESQAFAAGLQVAATSIGADVGTLDHLFRHGFLSEQAGLVYDNFRKRCCQLTYLDISYGGLTSFSSLRLFINLDTLVADQNLFSSLATCPALPSLKTLSLNNNDVQDLRHCLTDVQFKLKSLVFLSLLGNPCCPQSLSDPEADTTRASQLYRTMVMDFLPGLKFLDSRALDHPAATTGSSPLKGPGKGKGLSRRASTRQSMTRGLSQAELRHLIMAPTTRRMSCDDDPLLGLADVKMSAGLISKAEYVHIMTVHRAVSVFMDITEDEREATAEARSRPSAAPGPRSGGGGGGGGGGASNTSSSKPDESGDGAGVGDEGSTWLGGVVRSGIRMFMTALGDSDKDGGAGAGAGAGTGTSTSTGTSAAVDPANAARTKFENQVITREEYDHIVAITRASLAADDDGGDSPGDPAGGESAQLQSNSNSDSDSDLPMAVLHVRPGPDQGGLTLAEDDDVSIVRVVGVREDGPAHACGFRRGDAITRVNGVHVQDLSLDAINKSLRNLSGSAVELVALLTPAVQRAPAPRAQSGGPSLRTIQVQRDPAAGIGFGVHATAVRGTVGCGGVRWGAAGRGRSFEGVRLTFLPVAPIWSLCLPPVPAGL